MRLVATVAGGPRLGSRGAMAFLPPAVEAAPPRHQHVTIRRGGEEVLRDSRVDKATTATGGWKNFLRRRQA
jgi:hypothetical protein